MGLNCFGKKKSKEPRTPLPSRESLDRPIVSQRQDTEFCVSETTPGAPALPQRYNKIDDPAVHKLDGTYQHSQKIAVNQSGGSPQPEPKRTGNGKLSRQSKIPLATQLSQEVLCTPIPIGGGMEHNSGAVKANESSPDPVRHEPIGQESGEDYLDPQKTQPDQSDTSVSLPPLVGRQKPIASISEEKKSEIFNDYFTNDGSLSMGMRLPDRQGSDESASYPEYSNVTEIFSPPPVQHKSARSPVHSEGNEHLQKSPRRPRPVPRTNAGSENSSRKHSLTSSDNDEPSFTYENIQGVLDDLPKTPTHSYDVSPLTPKPLPRARAATEPTKSRPEPQSLAQSMNVYVPSPTASGMPVTSPLQHQGKAKDGYVLEADYVPPSDNQPTTAVSHAPTGDVTARNAHPNGPVNLRVPVPRTSAEQGLIAGQQTKKGYLPMDQSPKTRAMHHEDSMTQGPANGLSETDISINLNMRVPVANVNDVHVPGYITILGDKDPTPLHSGPYYNISDQGNYVNPGDPSAVRTKPGAKSRPPVPNKEAEAIYY